MAILVTCPCGKQFNVKDELAGKRGKCAGCGKVVTVPIPEPEVVLAPTAPVPQTCPKCRTGMLPKAVICVRCGLDLRTGRQLRSPAAKEPAEESAKSPAAPAWLGIALVAAGLCLTGVVAAFFLIPWGQAPDPKVAAQAKQQPPNGVDASNLTFEEAFRAGRVVWQPVRNARVATRLGNQLKVESVEMVTKFKYDVDGRKSIDTTGEKPYSFPDREVTFGPGAVIRVGQDISVREGAIKTGDEWTWTGETWAAGKQQAVPVVPPAQPTGGEPASPAVVWAGRMAKKLEDRRFQEVDLLKRAGARMPPDTVKLWKAALEQATGDKLQGLALLQVILRYSPIWKGEEFLPTESQRYAGRAGQTPTEQMGRWRDGFAAATGDRTDELQTVLLLIQMDFLYDAERFRDARAAQLLPRLKSFTSELLQPWADVLRCTRIEAAIELIDNDWLFDKDWLKIGAADEALRALRTAPKTGAPEGKASQNNLPTSLTALNASAAELVARFGAAREAKPSTDYPKAIEQVHVLGNLKLVATVHLGKCGMADFSTVDRSPFPQATIDQLLQANSEGFTWQPLDAGNSQSWLIKGKVDGEPVSHRSAIWLNLDAWPRNRFVLHQLALLPERAKAP